MKLRVSKYTRQLLKKLHPFFAMLQRFKRIKNASQYITALHYF